MDEARGDPEIDVIDPGEPEPSPRFTGWPRQLDMWPLWMMLVERGWKPRPIIARPTTRDAVVRILDKASHLGACVAPRGGGSNVVGAAPPLGCCLLLDLSALDRILEVNEDDLYVSVEAGAIIGRVEEELNKRGYTLYYHPQSLHLASIGGSIAMLGSGAYMPGRGNIEDLVLWVEAYIPAAGRLLLGSNRSPRGWEGPGVKHLLTGSEGGLGVILSAGLRIRPISEHIARTSIVFPSFREGLEAAKRLTLWGAPSLVRLLDPSEASTLYGVNGALLLVEVEAPSGGLLRESLRYIDSLAQHSRGRVAEELFDSWLKARYRYDDYLEQLWSMGLWVDTIDTAAYWSRLERLNESLLREIAGVPGVVGVMSHAGHFYTGGASLYHTVVFERRLDTYWRIWKKAAATATRLGASLSHQHGWGLLRKPFLHVLGDNLRLYCMIKGLLDPNGVLNPWGLSSGCHRVG